MNRGIIYCMSTGIPGLVMIGKARLENYEERIERLETYGYDRLTDIKRSYIIEIDEYKEKMKLVNNLFHSERVGDTELFSLDMDSCLQFLSSLDGKQIYPADKPKDVIFVDASERLELECIPDGSYSLSFKKNGEEFYASLLKQGKKIYLSEYSYLNMESNKLNVPAWDAIRKSPLIKDGRVFIGFECDSLSMAASIVMGHRVNGWKCWKGFLNQTPLDFYRKKYSVENVRTLYGHREYWSKRFVSLAFEYWSSPEYINSLKNQ